MPWKCHICGMQANNPLEDMCLLDSCPECNARFTRNNWANDFETLKHQIPVTFEDRKYMDEEMANGVEFKEISYIAKGLVAANPEDRGLMEQMCAAGWEFEMFSFFPDPSGPPLQVISSIWRRG